ncbi:alpha/beta hydrolase fold domain-containing protein [Aeromicrobium sp. CF4.19]|uniref:alpha/beta hydrolase fold domain-containing protein n=1 Tax=Aeromicrobium sp. CF4.19 TaxID=3373082 RepID=UPI003EE7D6FE
MGTVEWDRDDRPMTWWTRLYVLGMRLARDKRAFEGEDHTRETALEKQRKGDAAPTALTRTVCRVRREVRDAMVVWGVEPRRRPVERVVLYLHGGGYIHPLTSDYWRLVRSLVAARARVVVPCYPLAPGATLDDVAPRLVDLVPRDDVATTLPTVVMGDSAGGALALVVARRCADAGGSSLASVIALCPWLDAELDDSEVAELESTDPMLAESGLRAAGRWWAGRRSPGDPEVSPVALRLEGLPPLDLFIGDRDILRPAVDRLADRVRSAPGVHLSVHETSAMFHVWMTRAIPEGRRTRRRLAHLLAERTP